MTVGLPTHAYLVAGDSKLVDAQAAMESGISAVMGALAGINMISGAGMLDSLACHSLEKLAIDAEAIASAQRLAAGIEARTDTLAIGMFSQTALHGDFLKLKETRALFRSEQHFPSPVIERASRSESEEEIPRDTFSRARARVTELLGSYPAPAPPAERRSRLLGIASRETSLGGLAGRPGIEQTAPILGI